jgi:hypothetical protein
MRKNASGQNRRWFDKIGMEARAHSLAVLVAQKIRRVELIVNSVPP